MAGSRWASVDSGEILRFLIVGGLSALMNTTIIVIFTELLGLHYLLSFLLCFLLVTGTGFILNRQWSFRVGGMAQWHEAARYCVVAVGGVITAMAISWGFVRLGLPYYIAVTLAACFLAPVNFISHRYWSFGLLDSRKDRANGEAAIPENVGLKPYALCPGRTSDRCDFGAQPRLSLETGHPAAPHVEIFQCKACGHGVTRPAMPDVAPLYTGRETEDFQERDAGWIRKLKHLHGRSIVRWIQRYAGQSPSLSADFGTGNGMLAASLAKRISSGRVIGLDFFDDPPAEIGEADYCSFSKSEELEGRLDLLTCFHVLEHDDNPHLMLSRLTRYLKPGGTLVIEVPNVDCVWTPWFGTKCENWYAPYHRLHFSRTSLTALLKSNGLEILGQADICGPTFALSMARVLGVRPNAAIFAIALAARPFQLMIEKITARPSALRVACRKS